MDFDVSNFNVRLRTIRLRELAVAVAVSFVITVVLGMIIPSFEGVDDLLMVVFASLVLCFFIWALRGTYGLDDNFSKVMESQNRREILYILILNLIFASIVISLISSVDALSYLIAPEDAVPMLDSAPEYVSPVIMVLQIFSSVILAPIFEELAFRGVLFNRLKIRIGVLAAMIISSLLFGLLHEFGGITSAFLFGMCMCVIYLKTDNILMTMSIHFLNNLIAVFLAYTSIDAFLYELPFAPITFLVSVIAGILILIYLYKEIKKLNS